jgi:hypothetical protein
LDSAGKASAAPSEAQQVFDRGVADMLAGRFDTACADIEKSYHLEPLPGVMFTLAECFAGAGKTASALSRYADFRTLLTSLPSERRLAFDERERLAIARSQELARNVPDLTIRVSKRAPDEVITLNGEALDAAAFGAPRRLDPGTYLVRAEAPGRKAWERSLTVENGEHQRIGVPALSPLRTAPPPPTTSPKPNGSSRPTWVYVSGGVGIAGMVVGISAGALALARKNDVDRHCPANECDATGLHAVDAGRSAAMASNIGFGVGAVGLAGAAVGWWLSSASRQPGTRSGRLVPQMLVSPTGAQLSFGGDFQ